MADGSRRVLAAGRLGAGLMMLSAIAPLTGCGSQTTAQKGLPLLHVRLGTQVALPEAARGDGFDKVTVYALRDPVVSANPSAAADQGYQLSAADVEVCAGPDGASTNNSTVLFPFPFQLTLSDGSFEGMLNDPTTQPPAISNVASKLRPNQCARGFAPFEHKRSLSVRAVGFGSADAPIFEWAVSEPAP